MTINNDRRRRGRSMHIAEVAALAGVSIATVSRALANPDRVNAKTRAHVLEVVRRTGYTPNVAGRSLRAARSRMVLVVVPTFITPFFSDLLLGVDRALTERGYGLLIGNLQDGAAKEQALVDLVRAGQADGVLLLNGHILRRPAGSLADVGVPDGGGERAARPAGRPAGRPGRRSARVPRPWPAISWSSATASFGYVTGPAGSYIEAERWAGFRATLAAAGIAADAIVRYPGDFHVRSGLAAGEPFLRARGGGRPRSSPSAT